MKVLFVASGNKKVGQVNSFVRSQYDSLEKEGLDMYLFPVVGHGVGGYLKAVLALRKMMKDVRPDIIHAHYSVCGHVAVLACFGLQNKPKIVVSILGSFPTKSRKWRLVRYCIQNVWDATIVKSERTRSQLGLDLPVIPNGVNLDIFQPMEQADARKNVGFETNHKYIIWCSNPSRSEKNWPLAEQAVESVKRRVKSGKRKEESVELVAVYDKTPQEVATYMNAADCLLLTSDSEGSPNVIKEAMACNCPIVTTDVGDVNERLTNLDGCYVVGSGKCKEKSVADAIEKALTFGKRTEGRKRIENDKLSVELIAKRIIKLYESI